MSKVKKLSNKITFKKHEDCHTIVISPTIDRWQMNSLFVWLLGWTFCGFVFGYYLMFNSKTPNEIIIFGILLVFWLYFEIRIARAFLWRKYGLEIIKIDAKVLSVKDSIFQHGKAVDYDLTQFNAEDVVNIHVDPKSYGKVMNDSFWQVGQGTICLKYGDKQVYFGTQLENQESDKLAKHIRKIVAEYKGRNTV